MRQLFYYKLRQKFITKCVRFFITKCDSFTTKCDRYYQLRQFYYKMRQLLQNATFITNCDSTIPTLISPNILSKLTGRYQGHNHLIYYLNLYIISVSYPFLVRFSSTIHPEFNCTII